MLRISMVFGVWIYGFLRIRILLVFQDWDLGFFRFWILGFFDTGFIREHYVFFKGAHECWRILDRFFSDWIWIVFVC